jgi:hypothetical protein
MRSQVGETDAPPFEMILHPAKEFAIRMLYDK